ncbi:hypothetical protein D3C71_795830 [compost metagenome]
MYLSLFVAGFAQAQTTNPSPYCAAQFSDDFMTVEHAVERVQFGTLDNNSGPTQYAAPHYVFYNNLPVVTVNKGQTLNLKITHDLSVSLHGLAAWIDFNGDHDFNDAGEKLGDTPWPNDVPTPTGNTTYSVTIPTNAVSGATRMRIRVYEDDDYTMSGNTHPVMPCQFNGTDADWGETEDYIVTIAGGSTAAIQENLNSDEYLFKNQHFTLLSEEATTMSLISINGQVLATTADKTIDLSTYSEGIYLIRIQTTDGAFKQVKLLK